MYFIIKIIMRTYRYDGSYAGGGGRPWYDCIVTPVIGGGGCIAGLCKNSGGAGVSAASGLLDARPRSDQRRVNPLDGVDLWFDVCALHLR